MTRGVQHRWLSDVPRRIEGWSSRQVLARLGALYLAAHAMLLTYDFFTRDAFLQGDRADSRMEKILSIINDKGHFLPNLVANSDPGDYLYQAALYALSGQYGTIVFQIFLGFVSVICTYFLAVELGFSATSAFVSGLVMILMPGSLWQPHTLVTEALYNPLLACFSLLMAKFLLHQTKVELFYFSLVSLCLAISIRSQLAGFPIALTVYFLSYSELRRRRFLFAVIPVSLSLSLIWTLLLIALAGSALSPASDHGLSANLYQRASRMALVDGFAIDPDDLSREGEFTLAKFSRYVEAHPAAYVKTILSDGVNLVVNPGSVVILTRYFDWAGPNAGGSYWTRIRDQKGILGVAAAMMLTNARLPMTVALLEVVWLCCLLASCMGFYSTFLAPDARLARVFLLMVFAYSLAVPFASGSVRWQHRTSVDFILSMLIAAGAARVVAVWPRRHGGSPTVHRER